MRPAHIVCEEKHTHKTLKIRDASETAHTVCCKHPSMFIHKQDKVNYAVSEREDRVTDLTTLIRMTGCTGMFWAANGLY